MLTIHTPAGSHAISRAESACASPLPPPSSFFFFNDTANTEIYTLSLHDALPIYRERRFVHLPALHRVSLPQRLVHGRSEEHTSELQSHSDLVCRLLLENKNAPPPAATRRACGRRRSAAAARPTRRAACSLRPCASSSAPSPSFFF